MNHCVEGFASDNKVVVGAGDDTVLLGAGNDSAKSGAGSDVVFGFTGSDDIDGSDGEDLLFGGPGDDHIRGGFGDDAIDGGADDDLLRGGHGDDEIFGGTENDAIDGDQGSDRLLGGGGDDVIDGGPGDDTLIGGPGSDDLRGGQGDDTFEVPAACGITSGDQIDGGPGYDRVVSYLSEAELTALGVQFSGIEEFVTDDVEAGACYLLPDGTTACDCCDDALLDASTGCSACAEGYHFDPATAGDPIELDGGEQPVNDTVPVCVANTGCEGFECGDGTCDDSRGYPRCECSGPFIGESCEQCRPGLVLVEGECVASPECDHDFCSGNGACAADPAGLLTCECDEGFDGPNCGTPDLVIGADPNAIETGSSLAMYPSLANAATCPSGFDWTIVQGPGAIEQNAAGLAATYIAPASLEPGTYIDAATIRVSCKDDPSLWQERAACVLADDSLPVGGTCKQALIPVDNAMLAHLSRTGQNGATLALTHADQLVYLRSYGWKSEGPGLAMETCTPMRLASVSKAFTRAAAFRLDQDGVVLPDGSVFSLGTVAAPTSGTDLMDFRDLLSITEGDPGPNCAPNCATSGHIVPAALHQGFAPNLGLCQAPFTTGLPDPRLWNVEVRNLYNHNSGFPTNAPFGGQGMVYLHPGLGDPANNDLVIANDLDLPANVVGGPKTSDLLEWVAGACLLYNPGSITETALGGTGYSNIAYTLLGEVVAKVAGQDLVSYLQGTVLPDAGIVLGTDVYAGDNVLFAARTLPQVNDPDEPVYVSAFPFGQSVFGMKFEESEWVRGAPSVGGGYNVVIIENQVGGGGLATNAATLARFLLAFNLNGTPRVPGDLPIANLAVGGNGVLPGTTAWAWAWTGVPRPYPVPEQGTPYNSLQPANADPPDGLVQVALLFNSDPPRPGALYPNYDDGTQNPRLVIDGITGAIGTGDLIDSANWPLPLTEPELDWGCNPYVPPPPPESCGDSVLNDEDEECDGADFGGTTCASIEPYDGGTLGCDVNCKLVYDDCINPLCGNGQVDPNEQCDPGNGIDPVVTGNPNSEQFCNPTSCQWQPCGPDDIGREGCPCTEPGPDSEGDRCPGVGSDDGMDLICRHGPNHSSDPGANPPDDGKRCMRCPYNDGEYGTGSGCPCGPGDQCSAWTPLEQGPQVPVCTRNEMVCRGSVGDLINGEVDDQRRCWDVVTADPYANLGNECDQQACGLLGGGEDQYICLYNDCESLLCLDGDGEPGICRAMGMICDPNPYGNGDPYCINSAACDIGGSFNGTSTCDDDTSTVLNGGLGVQSELWCPQPYRF